MQDTGGEVFDKLFVSQFDIEMLDLEEHLLLVDAFVTVEVLCFTLELQAHFAHLCGIGFCRFTQLHQPLFAPFVAFKTGAYTSSVPLIFTP